MQHWNYIYYVYIFIAVYIQTKSTMTQPRLNSFAVFSVVPKRPQKREKTISKGFKVGKNTAAGTAISFLANTNKAGMCGTSVCYVISITFSFLQWETASQHDCVLVSSNRKQKSTSVANILIRQPHEACKSKYLGVFSPTCVFAGSHFKINIWWRSRTKRWPVLLVFSRFCGQSVEQRKLQSTCRRSPQWLSQDWTHLLNVLVTDGGDSVALGLVLLLPLPGISVASSTSPGTTRR